MSRRVVDQLRRFYTPQICRVKVFFNNKAKLSGPTNPTFQSILIPTINSAKCSVSR